tara:strand:+ start:492 stop:701 length:210 start_codon:yes stop_codon:yes gene_type:complete
MAGVIVTSPLPTLTVMLRTTGVGSVLSTTKALFAPNEPEAPGDGKVNVALLPAESFIEDEEADNAVVDA